MIPPQPPEAPNEAEAPPTDIADGEAQAAEQPIDAAEGEAVAEQPVDSDAPDEDIVVTGTRIRQSSFNNAAPVEVISRKQIEQSPVSTMSQLVQYLTGSTGTASGLAVNLRGLGAGATLVLLNGRRLNPSGAGGTNADITNIPLAAVERLEVMKAGAAAIYGADAVGGVVNVITRRAWNGFRGQVEGKTTQDAVFSEYSASASFGSVAERSRIVLATSYFRRGDLTAMEREELTRGKYVSTQGHPGAFLVPQDPSPAMPMMIPPPRLVPDPLCPPALIENTFNGAACRDDYRPQTSLLPAAERLSAFGSAQYDLTEHTTVFGELLLARTRTRALAGIFGVLPPYPVVPANHVDNPFGKDVQWMGRPRGGREHLEPHYTVTGDDSVRGVVGLKGDLEDAAAGSVLQTWSWEIYSSVGTSRYRRTLHDNLRDTLQMALDSCSDPADLSRCFNPFYSSYTGAGTANSQEVINRIAGRESDVSDHLLQTVNAGIDGTLFALPGGDVGFALGGEFRHESRSSEVDHDYLQGRYGFIGGGTDLRARRNVYSGYLEVRWPFLPGLELQTAARMERYSDIDQTPISPFAGLTWEPARSFGVEHSAPAFSRLALRANVSKAFRAPTVFQTYPGSSTAAQPLTRPGMRVATWTPVATRGNPALGPETAYTVSGGFNWAPINELSFAADLWYYNYKNRIQAEVASQILEMWQVSGGPTGQFIDPRVVYDPTTDTVGPIYTMNINVAGAVVTSGLDFGVTLAMGRADRGLGQLLLAPAGTYTFSYTIPRRETTLRSFTNTMGMQQRLGPKGCSGSADVDLDMDPRNNTFNDLDSCEVAGSRNANNIAPAIPRLKFNVPFSWNVLGHSLGLVGHYIGAYDDDLQPLPTGELNVIPVVFTLDVEYGYTLTGIIGERFGLRVGVENVFNKLPPVVNGATAAFDGENHDPRGRVFFAKLNGDF